jgi:hypothetical protein
MAGVTVDDVLSYAADFERSYVAVVHGRIKLRVKQIVYVAFSRDETTMGFGFPKDDRPALVASDPERFFLPRPSEMRFHWVETRLDRLENDEMREFVLDAWGMVVPKFLFKERLSKMGLTGATEMPTGTTSSRSERASSPSRFVVDDDRDV